MSFDYARQPTAGKPVLHVRVQTPPDPIDSEGILPRTPLEIAVTDDFTGGQLLEAFACRIELWQHEFFHLAYVPATSVKLREQWVDPNRTLAEQGIRTGTLCTVRLRYYKEPWRFVDPVAVHLYFTHARDRVIGGQWWASSKLTQRLAGLQLQVYFGDVDARKHGDLLPVEPELVYPRSTLALANTTVADHVKRARARWAAVSGLTRQSCTRDYLLLCELIPVYGGEVYDLRNRRDNDNSVALAVVEEGVLILREKRQWDLHQMKDIISFRRGKTNDVLLIDLFNMKGTTGYQLQGDEDDITEILERLSVYLRLLEEHPKVVMPVVVPDKVADRDDALDARKYRPPKGLTRSGEPKDWSRLETFRQSYLKMTNEQRIPQIYAVNKAVTRAMDTGTNWTRLVLADVPTPLESLKCFAQALKLVNDFKPAVPEFFDENIQLAEIDLAGLSFDAHFTPVQTILQCTKLGIRSVNLGRTELDAQSILQLAKPILSASVGELILSQNPLTDRGALVLTKALKSNPFIRRLDLRSCKLTHVIAEALGTLVVNNPMVTELVLDQNNIGTDGLRYIISALKFTKNFQVLSVSKTGISDIAVKDLLALMNDKPNIRALNIARNALPPSIGKDLADYMSSSTNIRSLSIGGNKFASELGPLLSAIAGNRFLESLSIADTSIKKKTIGPLCELATRAERLTSLSVSNCFGKKHELLSSFLAAAAGRNWTHLNLSHNDCGHHAVISEVCKAISQLPKLEELVIKDCRFADTALDKICNAIATCKSMRSVDFSKNSIGKNFTGIIRMVSIAAVHRSLVALFFRHCNLNHEFLEKLIDVASPPMVTAGGVIVAQPLTASSSTQRSPRSPRTPGRGDSEQPDSPRGVQLDPFLRFVDLAHNGLDIRVIGPLLSATTIRVRFLKCF